MSKDINKAPAYCPNAVATKRGWEDPKTGELLVSNRTLDLDAINGNEPVSVNEPVSADVETTLFDEMELMEVEEPVSEEVDFDSMTKTEICAYADNILDIQLNHKDTKKSLINQINGI